MTKHLPTLSIILPVFNAEKYIAKSIESILSQTFSDYELIIINDGSNDDTLRIAQSYTDERIKIYSNQQNQGLIPTLNWGFRLAKGNLIARMDADDMSDKHRLELQFNFMKAHPQVDLCGTQAIIFDQNKQQRLTMPLQNDEIKAHLLWGNSIIHATLMLRKSFWLQHQLSFDLKYLHAEDYDLWTRCLDKAHFANLPEVLYHIRSHSQKVSIKNQQLQIQNTKLIYQRQLQKLGIKTNQDELDFHRACKYGFSINLISLDRLSEWLLKLLNQNQLKKIYPEAEFYQLLKQTWRKHTTGQTQLGVGFLRIIQQNPLSDYHEWSAFQKMKFKAKCLLKRK